MTSWQRCRANFRDRVSALRSSAFLLRSRTSASAERRHWSGRAVRWSSCAILLRSAPSARQPWSLLQMVVEHDPAHDHSERLRLFILIQGVARLRRFGRAKAALRSRRCAARQRRGTKADTAATDRCQARPIQPPNRLCGAARRHRLRSPFDAARVAPEKLIRISLPRRLPFADDTLQKVTGNAAPRNTTGSWGA